MLLADGLRAGQRPVRAGWRRRRARSCSPRRGPACGSERPSTAAPGDPSSGTVGASGANLLAHPDSYAELGGYTFADRDRDGRAAVHDAAADHLGPATRRSPTSATSGFGGGPVDGLPRVIDLWWQFAGALGIPYEQRAVVGAGADRAAAGHRRRQRSLGRAADRQPAAGAGRRPPASVRLLTGGPAGAVPLTPGPRAQPAARRPGRRARRTRRPAVKEIIAAGNQIVGKPYLYGGGHGLPLDQVASAYDCSSSVEHLLYGGRLLPVTYDAASGTLESFGLPGPGRWVTIYASADHVFMYVAGLRWDTHNAAGPQDGSAGIGWHPLVRSAAGFVARHPVGL